jgi:2,3-diketo-5-methylthio-1-phosphopentane phosphatase
MAVAMHQMGVDGSQVPATTATVATIKNQKKRKLLVVEGAGENGFHGMAAVNNAADCRYSNIPLLPRDTTLTVLLLDIEGCTTSISFVKDVLFPYCRKIFTVLIEDSAASSSWLITDEEVAGLRREVQAHGGGGGDAATTSKSAPELALYLMDRDVKSAALKSLQGRLWQTGYENGQLRGHVYADFVPAVDWMNQHNIRVCIYSSGSVQAQQLLFRHSVAGNLCDKLSAHFDIPTAGSKKESTSYETIAQSLGVAPSSICFVSDVVEELAAARAAGLGASVLSIRPGNAPVDDQDKADYPVVHSLLQLCGAE